MLKSYRSTVREHHEYNNNNNHLRIRYLRRRTSSNTVRFVTNILFMFQQIHGKSIMFYSCITRRTRRLSDVRATFERILIIWIMGRDLLFPNGSYELSDRCISSDVTTLRLTRHVCKNISLLCTRIILRGTK